MMPTNLWSSAEHAQEYLSHADAIPHRSEGEAELRELVPRGIRRILDLGTGDGRLLMLLQQDHPQAEAVGLDFSPAMLKAAVRRFAGNPSIAILDHDLDAPLPSLGKFDAVVSSFAIHHLAHERKRVLYAEIYRVLTPGGVFCNLEHVASPTIDLHQEFLRRLNLMPATEDPSNQLLDVETQLRWLREIGFADVDCHWKWRELALLAGRVGLKESGPPSSL